MSLPVRGRCGGMIGIVVASGMVVDEVDEDDDEEDEADDDVDPVVVVTLC